MLSPSYALTNRLDRAAQLATRRAAADILRQLARKAACIEADDYYRAVMRAAREERARRDAVMAQARRA